MAWLPASDGSSGWTCTYPSPWVLSPTRTFGFDAAVSNVGGLMSHSPQMFTPNAVYQWSPGAPLLGSGARGGFCAGVLEGRSRVAPMMAATMITRSVP